MHPSIQEIGEKYLPKCLSDNTWSRYDLDLSS